MKNKIKELEWNIVFNYSVINILISILMVFLLSVFLMKNKIDGSNSILSYILIFVMFRLMMELSKKMVKQYYKYELIMSSVISFLISAISKLLGFPIIQLGVEKIYDTVIKFASNNDPVKIEKVNDFIKDDIYFFHGVNVYYIIPLLTGVCFFVFFFAIPNTNKEYI